MIKTKLRLELNVTSGSLYDKTRSKTINSNRFKWKVKNVCPLPNCLPANKVAIAGLPNNIGKPELIAINSNFTAAKDIEFWTDDSNIAFVSFDSRHVIHNLIRYPLKYNAQLLNTSEVFFTSTIKSGHKKLDSTLMFYNLAENSTVEQIKSEIHSQLANSVSTIRLFPIEKMGIIQFVDQAYCMQLKLMSSHRNFTINKRIAKVLPVTYVWLPVTAGIDDIDEDSGTNRFADNEELKYSLRSVEKFAPWIRRIFIVTNGQIPNWLNLNHPRIKLISHHDIFLNKSHLPTFSSPAIESNLHRIPGVSKKFIYMNDDVFFGKQVWPDDFYTHSKGHKVFLTWAVPNCHEGCPASWVSDKYCDKACNVSACEWDGGDCLGPHANKKWSLQASYNQYIKATGEYCSGGCAHNWIGDRYCDGNCNKLLCGFDAGDCSLRNFNQLYSYSFDRSLLEGKVEHITAPPGTLAMYLNLTNVFTSILEGNFQDHQILRTAIISKKFKILSLTFFKNISESTLSFQVLGYKDLNKTNKAVAVFKLNISTIQTIRVKASKQRKINRTQVIKANSTLKPIERLYNGTTYAIGEVKKEEASLVTDNILDSSLPVKLADKLQSYRKAYEDGDLTHYGFNRSKQMIYAEYLKEYEGENTGRKLLWLTAKKGNLRKFHTRASDDAMRASDDASLNKLLTDQLTTAFSFLPWEKSDFMITYFNLRKRRAVQQLYRIKQKPKRHLLDAFSDSLLHVSRIYNKAFGYIARKVPAHMPHMVDRDIIEEMQARFASYFDATSSHKLRHPEDMQFAFSFNYYLIGVQVKMNLSQVFDKVDSDNTGWLSEREQRSLAAILYPLPLSLQKIKEMENHLKNCSKRMDKESSDNSEKSPLITRKLFINCHQLWQTLNITSDRNKFHHEIQGEEDVIFKMIRNNASYVLQQLDWIRKNRKKFICLNDDLDHNKASSKIIRTILKDFYESFFPVPSQFELSPKYRNKFTYKWQLDEWLLNNKRSNEKINVVIIFIVVLLTMSLYRRKLVLLCKRLWRVASGRRRGRNLNLHQDALMPVYVKESEELVSVL